MPAEPLMNTLVTLYVNTTADLSNQTVLENNVWFADTDGDVVNNNGVNVKEYLTEVTKNGNITWVGAVLDIRNNPTDYVTITGISPTPPDGNNKLNIDEEPGTPANGNVTHMSARVTGNPSPLPFEYSITFVVWKIDDAGVRNGTTCQIDPRIRIKQ